MRKLLKMKTEKGNKILSDLVAKIEKDFDIELITEELKKAREIALAEEDPLLVRVLRQIYEYLAENEDCKESLSSTKALLEQTEEQLSSETNQNSSLKESVSSLTKLKQHWILISHHKKAVIPVIM